MSQLSDARDTVPASRVDGELDSANLSAHVQPVALFRSAPGGASWLALAGGNAAFAAKDYDAAIGAYRAVLDVFTSLPRALLFW